LKWLDEGHPKKYYNLLQSFCAFRIQCCWNINHSQNLGTVSAYIHPSAFVASTQQYMGVGIGELDGPDLIPGIARSSLLHSIQTNSRAHPAFYPMDTGGTLAGVLS
jgi:hypothetical protein